MLKALLLGLPLALLGFLGLLLGLGWALRPDLQKLPLPPSPEEVAAAVRARDVHFDARAVDTLPRIERPIDPTLGHAAPWWPKGESPVLRDLVAAGKLPPVIDRVGSQPVVLDGGSIGRYGGTWRSLATSASDVFMVEFRFGYPSLFRWSPLGDPIVPHLGLRVDESEDKRSFVVHLRPGVRWSDGYPFGADDVLFWWRYDELDPVLGDGAPPPWLIAGGGQTRLEKIDDLTLRFSFDEPFGNFMEVLAANSYWMARFPRHYLEKYHPRTADPAFLARELDAFGLSSPRSLWDKVRRFDNPECPRLWPWVPRTFSDNAPYVFVRNPYYFAVDPEGNQLPYIERLQFDVKTSQMLPLALANGEVTMQGRHVSYESYTELMSRQKAAGFRVLHWYPASRSSWLINPNQNRLVDPARPATLHKAKLLADKRFHQALSLAIDRPSIIRARFDDQVRPSQVEPGPESAFHSPKLRDAYIAYDPGRANLLLDELGLTGRDSDGMRTFADGSAMAFELAFSAFTGLGPGEFVVEDLRSVGLRVTLRELSRNLFVLKRDSADFDFLVWSSESDHFPLVEPRSFVAPDIDALYATSWGRWFTRGGFYGAEAVKSVNNAFGPPADHPMHAAMRALIEARQKPSLPERVARFGEALDIAAESLWTINIAEAAPFLVVVDQDLKNVPANALYSAVTRTPGNAGIEAYYFEHPRPEPTAALSAALTGVTPMTRLAPPGDAELGPGGVPLERLIRWSLAAVAALLLILVGLRHPFVVRRVAILVPTLLIVSVVVFAVIELPPGDYLSSRVLVLSETGDHNSMQQLAELRSTFHFDDPAWKRYLAWLGVPWFWTWQAADLGLLQGFMGRSMENLRSVNAIVGDRILLTLLISLGSILFTWALAIPIGVYSAVKQYSFGDHLFSLVGFLGMSVPPFLLALVLMVLSGVSGLLSPEYLAQPGWTLDKVLDLAKHIWIPIVVLGVGGTASLARVMRANLLDELKKPYVTTARARGVRPLRLLFKYPVRMALTPFVAGIGQLFPQLVSGGAIVGIVLSLPIVGPLQVEALLSEDTLLAGSMLMVLSLLSVFGTLVADLLLLWLDPRIRYDKGPG